MFFDNYHVYIEYFPGYRGMMSSCYRFSSTFKTIHLGTSLSQKAQVRHFLNMVIILYSYDSEKYKWGGKLLNLLNTNKTGFVLHNEPRSVMENSFHHLAVSNTSVCCRSHKTETALAQIAHLELAECLLRPHIAWHQISPHTAVTRAGCTLIVVDSNTGTISFSFHHLNSQRATSIPYRVGIITTPLIDTVVNLLEKGHGIRLRKCVPTLMCQSFATIVKNLIVADQYHPTAIYSDGNNCGACASKIIDFCYPPSFRDHLERVLDIYKRQRFRFPPRNQDFA